MPASTSNCGPGFDTLGIAFALYNTVEIERLPDARIVSAAGPGCQALEMVGESAAKFFSSARTGAIGFRYRFAGEVPPSRGLGSSVTVRAGIVAAMNALSGAGLNPFEIAAIVTDLEGHPDNATAGVLGGLCVGRSAPDDGRLLDVVRFEVPDSLAFVIASPELEVKTNESRSVLPARIPFGDAVRSVNGASFFVAAFASGDYDKLRHGFDDFLHEPHRLPKIPGAQDALTAGRKAGALGAWLSGSGSSVACLVWRRDAEAISAAMSASLARAGVAHVMRVLSGDNTGIVIERC
ncbi:MAG TPA: homoserine kinase [Opitutaceae bacterium]